jgi:hypothetical protein
MTEAEPLPPDYYCPNPALDCPGRGRDLVEHRESIYDAEGREIGVLITVECRRCGYRWGADD